MGSTNTEIKCPFFRSETNAKFFCEGWEGTNTVSIKFDKPDEKNAYMEKHCCVYPNKCPIFETIEKEYATHQ